MVKRQKFRNPKAVLMVGAVIAFGAVVFFARAAPLVGDINGDGVVNVTDLSLLLSKWGTADASADLNHDGTVNVLDLSALLAHWGQSAPTPTPSPTQSPTPSPTAAAGSIPANVDYGYGDQTAGLNSSGIHGVVANLNWSQFEATQGTYNWSVLDNLLKTWAPAGKHVVICMRFAGEASGQNFLPAWEIARIPTLQSLNAVPDYFNATFQSDWLAAVNALGAHLAASQYKSAVSYVRIGVGLGGEGFYLMYSATNPNYASDLTYIENNWGYTPQAWEAWQKQMLTSYRTAIPTGIPVLYPIIKQDTNPATGNPVDLDVAEWAVPQGGFGLSQDNIPDTSGAYGSGAGYASINTILSWTNTHYPNTYIQFQAVNGLTSAQVNQTIANAEGLRGRTIEWYQQDATNAAFQSLFPPFQQFVDGL
jgi:hypothetical protein